MKLHWLVALSFVVAACDKDGEKKSDDSKEESGKAVANAPETPTTTEPAKPDKMAAATALLGATGPKLALLEGKPTLGATVDELKKSWGETLCKIGEEEPKLKEAFDKYGDSIASLKTALQSRKVRLCLPGDFNSKVTWMESLSFDTLGRVSQVALTFRTKDAPELDKGILALLEKKFGPAIPSDKQPTVKYHFDKTNKRRLRVATSKGSIALHYTAYWPVEEIIGGDGPGLSFEKDKTIGGTYDDIKASDPDHFLATGDIAFLIYPPADFNVGSTEVWLNRWDKRKKTHGYRVVIHHGNHKKSGDKVFELLKAKFGEPKKDKKSTDKDTYYNFKANGRKVKARLVSDQWQISVEK